MTKTTKIITVHPTLAALVERADSLKQLRKSELGPGDYMIVQTANSLYHIGVLGGGKFLVSGGWFDRHGSSPARVGITGCSWGGSAIKVDVVAACGLCLEFSNRVRTSAIRKFFVFHRSIWN